MAKRRRKLSAEQKAANKQYKHYVDMYRQKRALYGANLNTILNKRDFLEAYKDYKAAGSYHTTSDIIRDQLEITRKQSKAYAKNLKENIMRWQKDPSKLTEEQKRIIKLSKRIDLSDPDAFFKQQNKRNASRLLAYINNLDYWEEAVGS